MLHTWTTLGATALFAVVLIGRPCAAQVSDQNHESLKQEDVRQQLEQLRSDTIRSFQAAKKDIDAMREDIAHLRKELDEVRNAQSSAWRKTEAVAPEGASTAAPDPDAQGVRKELNALKEEIVQLGKSLDDLNRAGAPRSQISAYPPSGTAAATGTIRLSNTYREAITIIVNGESYNLAPGESRILTNQPAGRFTYEVVGVQPMVERTLAAGAAFPIVVHP